MKPEYWQFDNCPKCEDGVLEVVDCKGEQYLECNECEFTYHFPEEEV